MKKAQGNPNGLHLPEIEVTIRAASYDVAVICFWQLEDQPATFDLAVGVSSEAEVAVLVELLQESIKALKSASWYSLDVLDSEEPDKTEDPIST